MSILLTEETTFIVQGITGREAVNLTRECLDYGSKMVGGVTPGRKGREVHGVPVFDTVEQAVHTRRASTAPWSPSPPPSPRTPSSRRSRRVKRSSSSPSASRAATWRKCSNWPRSNGARIIGPNCLGLVVPDVSKRAASAARPGTTKAYHGPGRGDVALAAA